MPRKITPPEDIDEDFLRDLVGEVSPVLRNPDATASPSPQATCASEAAAKESGTASSRRRRIILPDYANTFLKHSTLRRRVTVNINEETRDTLIAILQHIGPFHLSLGGYVENILRNHIETYRDEINSLNRDKREQKIL